MARVVHAGFQAVRKLDAEFGLLVLEVVPDLACAVLVHVRRVLEDIREVSVMLAQIGKIRSIVVEKGALLLGNVADLVGAAELDPSRKCGDVFGNVETVLVFLEAVSLGEFGAIRSNTGHG